MRSVFTVPRHTIRWAGAATLLLACAAASLVLSAQTQTAVSLTLVSTSWPPFTNVPGQPRFALDLVETALGRARVTARTTIIPAAEFTPSLLTGQNDGSAAVWRDPERERVLLYSRPYLENRLVLVGRAGADVSATTLGGLRGKRIAVVEGYSYGAIDGTGPVLVRSSSEEDSLARLLRSEVDYTLMDELVVQYMVSNYPTEAATKLKIGTASLIRRELYLAVRRSRRDAEAIVNTFNEQLRNMVVDRTYHRMLHVDWLRADVNGDGVPEYVPASDRVGPKEPDRTYTLFLTSPTGAEASGKRGFYVGGTIYSDWASVPENYKLSNSDAPDPRRSTATIFTFRW